jgi:hypothetical protein
MAHAKMSLNNNIRRYFAVAGADMVRYFCKREIDHFESVLVDGPA